ncbi:hypothetical protein UCDDA912_g10131 [Diaporthe ampelina]|uniref:Uncharacterized protein n=1 Tax=Diaporthe ampelina TaxID=1214573 RepID=A0A0G2HP19_9PEZI|nr:hypothetical protein UCDDA912_g10131 [Diaporthe ampelina]
METLFYALGVLLSGALICHFLSQFSFSIWLIYFIVGKMWPFINDNDPWDPVQDKIDDTVDGLTPNFVPSARKGGKKGGGKKKSKHDDYWNDDWKANPKAMTIVTVFYLIMCLLLVVWTAYIFARVVRLGRRQQSSAIRTVLHLTANRLATPAFAAVIMLAGYLAWGSWTWFVRCEPFTPMSNLNLTNALMLTVPTAIFTIAWVVGTGCEIAWHIRNNRQDDIPLPNLGPVPPAPAAGAGAAAAGGGGQGDGQAAERRRNWRREVVDVIRGLARHLR